jgi:DNA replication protein DnaC
MELAEENEPAADSESVPSEFHRAKANAVFLGGVGLGKTHLCIALGHIACLRGTLSSVLLDRLLHHAETCIIEGSSFRAKDHVEM